MMTAVGQKADFSGTKRSGNTPAVLTQRATPKIRFLSTAPWGCGDNSAGGCVGFAFTARKSGCSRNMWPRAAWVDFPEANPQGEQSGSERVKAVLPVAHCSRNSLVAIKSAFP